MRQQISETPEHLTDDGSWSRVKNRNKDAFAEAEQQGLMLAAKVRTIALCFVLLWVAVDTPSTGISFLYDTSQVALFAALGVIQYYSSKYGLNNRWLKYAFVVLDCFFLALITSVQNPFTDFPVPPAILMNSTQFLYFFLFLMQAAFSFRPSLVLWCGLCIALARTGMLVWFVVQPDTFTNLDLDERTIEALVKAREDPNFIFLGFWAQEILVCLLLAAGLAALVHRSRHLVESRIHTERSRASLARYFSPNIVDRLGISENNLGAAREQEVAILFADIVGFTELCENDTPSEIVAFLRDYHNRLAKAVFENGGTLDKYLGDGLMATFGTPDPSPNDAENAVQCAFDMLDALNEWNGDRKREGLAPVRIGIGIHFGLVVAGDIGNPRRLEYSVIGDAVNVASRIEHLTRELGAPLAVSEAVINAIGDQSRSGQSLLERLTSAGSQNVRGRRGKIDVWIHRSEAEDP